jgi:5-methylcytosine-specific restriction endonuclease McrA
MNWNEQRKVLKDMGYSSYRDYIAGVVWANIREKVFEEKGKRCVICNRKRQLHYDHDIPFSKSATRRHMKDCRMPSYPFGMSLPQHA